MADPEDPEETSAPQESDDEIPGIPDDFKSSISSASKTSPKLSSPKMSSPKMSKIESLVTTILQNGSPSASEIVPLPEDPTRDPSIQSQQEETSILEETSKSQEELKKSQELSLNGKKTSLDQLSKDMFQNGQKPRAARLHRQCQRRFRELIGKREMKNEELEKQQGDLKHRLNILECSMPAVMVWNIWRMSQGACVPSIKQVLEKSFQGPASGEVYCPSTPSRHFDCRVREVEAERKQAQKRAEEARTLWAEKAAALEEKNKKLEEARKAQEQIKENIEKLKIEAQKLREAAAAKMKDDGACESGECGVIECKKKWLDKVPSSASIKSTDIECLEELQQLAETELCMKRQIADLERREEAYMRTLQQADELWSKLQGDAASTMSTLQEQLDVKTAANQQMADRIVQLEDMLEKLRTRMANCRNELEKYMSIGKIEALIGRDDDFADVVEQKTSAEVLQLDQMVGSKDDVASVSEKDVLAKPDVADLTTGVQRDDLIQLDEAQLAIKSEDVEEKQKLEGAKDYLASYGSLSELFIDDDYVCAPDFICNDQVFTETGLTEEEMKALKEGRVTAEMLLKKLEEADGISTEVTVKAGEVPGVMMKTIERAEGSKEAVELLHEVGEEEMIAVDEITVESDRKIDDDQETLVTALEETEIDAVQEAFIEAPMTEEEIVERMTAEAEVEDYTLYQDAVGDDNILVPRDELLTWQGNVDAVRETIATCPDCLVVKKDADEVAEMIARYTGITMRDVIDDPRRRKEEIEELSVLEQVSPTEIEVQVEEKEQIEPEIEEAEVITAQPPKQEEVSLVGEEIAPSIIEEEIKDIEEPITAQKVAEVEAPPEKQKIVTPTVSVVQEVSTEPSKVSVPQVVSVREETPSLAKEEIPHLMKEAVPVAVEISPKEVEKVPVEAVPAADKEDTMTPVAVDEVKKTPIVERMEDKSLTKVEEIMEVEVVKEVASAEEIEVKQVVSPEEKEKDVDAITIKEKEVPKVVEAEIPVEKKEDEAPVSREEETESRILPEEDEMVAAQKKEIEDDLLPEVEEKKAPEEEKVEVDMLEVMEGPKEEDIAVELLSEKEEIPVPTEEEVVVELLSKEEEDIALELLPEKEEEEIPTEEEVALELLPEREEEEIPTEEEVALELLPQKEEEEIPTEDVTVELLPEEVPKEEEVEMEMLPEEEEVSEPKEEGEEEAEVPTEEPEETTVLVVAVIPEEEVGIEAEEAPVPEEKVEEVSIEEIIEVEEIVDKEKIEEVPEEVGEEPAEEKEAEEEVTEVPVSEELEICIEEICEGPCKEEVPAEEKEEVIEVPVLEELEICIIEICEAPCKEEVPAEEKESEEEMEIPVEVCTVEICKEEICIQKVSVPEVLKVPKVPEVPAPEEMVSFPCVCFTKPEVPKDKEEAELLPCICFDEPEVQKEEEQLLPCICFDEPEVQKVPDKEEAQTFSCVCFAEPEASKVPVQEEAVCDCVSIPEEPAPKTSKAPVPEDPTKLCNCFFTLETPEAPAPKIPTPEVPPIVPFVSVLPTIAEQQTDPQTKIEITQTEFKTTMESMEVVTQTVSEIATQTPTNKFIRRSQQPKIITITKPVDPELEILDQLTRRLTPITEPSLMITTAASTQTEKSSFLQVKATCVDSRPPSLRISEILQSLKAEVAHLSGTPKSDQERELKSYHYGKKPKQPDLPKCNCCVCGKDVPSSISIDPRTQRQSSTVCCAQPPPPTTRRTVTPYTNQGVQYENICPECKIRKLQEALKSQESLRSSKKEAKKPTSDKEVCAVASITTRGIPFHRLKKKVDQCCSAKISKASSKESSRASSKASSRLNKPLSKDKVDPEKEVQEIMSATKATDKESLMHCVCSCEIETGEPGEFNRMHCACGDPD